MGPEFVRSVMIDGEWRLKDNRVVSCDEAAFRNRSVEIARGLYERMVAIL
jgi:hypothetical protein